MPKTLFLVPEVRKELSGAGLARDKKKQLSKPGPSRKATSRVILTYDKLEKLEYQPLPDADNVVVALPPAAALKGRILRTVFSHLGVAKERTLTILQSQAADPEPKSLPSDVDLRKVYDDFSISGGPPTTHLKGRASDVLQWGLLRALDMFVEGRLRYYFGVRIREWGASILLPAVAVPGFEALERYVRRHGLGKGAGFFFNRCKLVRGSITEQYLLKGRPPDIPLICLGKTENTCARAIRRGRCVWALVRTLSADLMPEDFNDLEDVSLRLLRWARGEGLASPESLRTIDCTRFALQPGQRRILEKLVEAQAFSESHALTGRELLDCGMVGSIASLDSQWSRMRGMLNPKKGAEVLPPASSEKGLFYSKCRISLSK